MSEPQPQGTVPTPPPTDTKTASTMGGKGPEYYPPSCTDKDPFSSPSTATQFTPSHSSWFWHLFLSIFTVFFIWNIITTDQRQGNRLAFGFHVKGDLDERLGYKLVEDVPSEKVPDGRGVKGGEQGHERVIVVGDVHGMYHELVSLLTKVKYNAENDYLVLAGDIISKGPDSLKVLDLARNYGAGCVRGNHEDRILLHYHQIHKKKEKKEKKEKKVKQGPKPPKTKKSKAAKAGTPPAGYNAYLEDDMEMDETEKNDNLSEKLDIEVYKPDFELSANLAKATPFVSSQMRTDRKLARKLSRKQATWLNSCPLVLRMNNVSNMGQVEVVHAGLVYGVKLEDQDPNAIMNMKTLDRRCHLPTDQAHGKHWADLWNKKEKKMGKHANHTTVIYGHYAAQGLDIRPYTKGLDSNCVRGGKLSAFVISSKHQEVVSVKCRSYLKD